MSTVSCSWWEAVEYATTPLTSVDVAIRTARAIAPERSLIGMASVELSKTVTAEVCQLLETCTSAASATKKTACVTDQPLMSSTKYYCHELVGRL